MQSATIQTVRPRLKLCGLAGNLHLLKMKCDFVLPLEILSPLNILEFLPFDKLQHFNKIIAKISIWTIKFSVKLTSRYNWFVIVLCTNLKAMLAPSAKLMNWSIDFGNVHILLCMFLFTYLITCFVYHGTRNTINSLLKRNNPVQLSHPINIKMKFLLRHFGHVFRRHCLHNWAYNWIQHNPSFYACYCWSSLMVVLW